MSNLFLDNKYTNYYFNIIKNSKKIELNEYFERHHIIPKSLGGKNDFTNIVKLSPRTHFICHLLLTKMTEGKDRSKMIHAANLLAQTRNVKINSRIYSTLKINISRIRSELQKGKPAWNRGIKTSYETKLKQSKIKIGREPWNKGKKCPSISIVRKLKGLGWKAGVKKTETTRLKMCKPKSPRHILFNKLSRFNNGSAKTINVNINLLKEVLKEPNLPDKYLQAGIKYLSTL